MALAIVLQDTSTEATIVSSRAERAQNARAGEERRRCPEAAE